MKYLIVNDSDGGDFLLSSIRSDIAEAIRECRDINRELRDIDNAARDGFPAYTDGYFSVYSYRGNAALTVGQPAPRTARLHKRATRKAQPYYSE